MVYVSGCHHEYEYSGCVHMVLVLTGSIMSPRDVILQMSHLGVMVGSPTSCLSS